MFILLVSHTKGHPKNTTPLGYFHVQHFPCELLVVFEMHARSETAAMILMKHPVVAGTKAFDPRMGIRCCCIYSMYIQATAVTVCFLMNIDINRGTWNNHAISKHNQFELKSPTIISN